MVCIQRSMKQSNFFHHFSDSVFFLSASERSAEIYLKLPDDNLRVIAETKYKIGLCYNMLCKFDESIAAFKDSADYLNGVIEAEKRKDEQNEKTEATINEIEETRKEIAIKIIEVQEAKDQVSERGSRVQVEVGNLKFIFFFLFDFFSNGH